jgi:hypothetical protein
MLSFIFVLLCGLFEWKWICADFYRLPMQLYLDCRWRFSYQEIVAIPFTGFIPQHICVCTMSGLTTTYVVTPPLFVFSELRWEVNVRFVDSGRIVDHHSLNLLFYNVWECSLNAISVDILEKVVKNYTANIFNKISSQGKLGYKRNTRNKCDAVDTENCAILRFC